MIKVGSFMKWCVFIFTMLMVIGGTQLDASAPAITTQLEDLYPEPSYRAVLSTAMKTSRRPSPPHARLW